MADTQCVTRVPFFRLPLGDEEKQAVRRVLDSGWLTTGAEVHAFETAFAAAVGARHAVAVNSGTAALHLALKALNVGPQQAVLVPTMTFAATAEVVIHCGAVPILVDCERELLQIDLRDAAMKIDAASRGTLMPRLPPLHVTGMIPVYVAGVMSDLRALHHFAESFGLWIVEDAAHAFPAAWRASAAEPWRSCGEGTADVTCFSFYANKTVTTGEGGMACTANPQLAARIRALSLHGLSRDAWERYSGGGWDYEIQAAGFKYNMTDVAAAIGVQQLAKAERMREDRESLARRYCADLAAVDAIELPAMPADRIHARHLFPIRLREDALRIDRRRFIEELGLAGVGSSVHWRPLHLHRYYEQAGWTPGLFPVATREWTRLVSLPIFPGMTDQEYASVVSAVAEICRRFRR